MKKQLLSLISNRNPGAKEKAKRPSGFLKNQGFGVYLFTSIVSLLVITVSAIVGYLWYQDKKNLTEISNHQMSQVTELVREKVTNYLTPVAVMAKLSSQILKEGGFDRRSGGKANKPAPKVKLKEMVTVAGKEESVRENKSEDQPGVLSIIDGELLEAYGIHVLKSFPQVAMINIGDEQGNFMMPKKEADGTIATKFIDRTSSPATEAWKRWDKNGKFIKTEPKAETSEYKIYDPRVRPWYKGAKESGEIYWADVYIVFSDQVPAIATAYPVFNAEGRIVGVLSMDIVLNELSVFLKQLKIGKTGIAYIVGEKKELIAYPDPSVRIVKEIVDEKNEKKRIPLPVEEIGIDWVAESFRTYEKEKTDRVEFESGGESYLASFTDLGDTFGKKWKIGVVVPEMDFLERLIAMRRVVLLISLAVFLISVFIAKYISGRISKPISSLTREAEKIADFQLQESPPTISRIREVQMLDASIASMKKGLRAFEKYVPSALVRQLIQTGKDAELGGEKWELTILFSDIQGFTDISEKVPPELLMVQLFEYNNELTNIIKENKGTIDKYIGDSIMAFWGAPVWFEEHAFLACKAALRCHRKVEELNRRFEKEKRSILITRIGINTGTTIVGNMGSDERMNYSVLGDSVNLASRIEGVNKVYGTRLIITDSTYQKVSGHFICRPLDIVAVKGKKQGVRIYELMGEKEDVLPPATLELREVFIRGFNAYLKQDWDNALKFFLYLRKKFPSDKNSEKAADEAVNLYIERCTVFRENPPGKDWDGIFHLKTK
jgi:adenylate cyclase